MADGRDLPQQARERTIGRIHVGVDGARLQQVDRDSLRTELARQTLGERNQRGLRPSPVHLVRGRARILSARHGGRAGAAPDPRRVLGAGIVWSGIFCASGTLQLGYLPFVLFMLHVVVHHDISKVP